MQICLISSASVYTDAALHSLLRHPDIKITSLVECTAIDGTQGNWRAYKKLISRSGPIYTGYLGAVTKPACRLPHVPKWKAMPVWSHSLNCPILRTNDVSSKTTLDFLEGCKPDIFLSVHLGQILRVKFYERFGGKTYNIHPGKLPIFKGPDPVFDAIMDDEKSFTVSLHESIQKIDSGLVLAEQRIVPQKRTLFRTNLELFSKTGNLVASHFLNKSDCLPTEDDRPARYRSWPTNRDVLKFLGRGNRL
ncbi:Phosphoribosylglycinamide formyltransferase [Pseudovibrio axinellae]|uniref:Phosphoribosylglycinamide formyltransferase n=1 Tax=Pseudovibrio axinellae TaxID=989403 RepID=A0A165W8F5_9HYPH|nr:formyltransferase family protein [Pseudovibrio axinellae]KZL16185.1 Phosphoribosylglycinamide formyltransferase [Pseudovibrio axinellae]SER76193.1 Formyl transferase [Pseudovibrio axinellae]